MTKERLENALKLKGNHKIYFCRIPDCPEGDIENAAEVADLSECIKNGETWTIPDPDHTPDWLYDIIDLFSGCELMESVFEFSDEETLNEFKEICDVII